MGVNKQEACELKVHLIPSPQREYSQQYGENRTVHSSQCRSLLINTGKSVVWPETPIWLNAIDLPIFLLIVDVIKLQKSLFSPFGSMTESPVLIKHKTELIPPPPRYTSQPHVARMIEDNFHGKGALTLLIEQNCSHIKYLHIAKNSRGVALICSEEVTRSITKLYGWLVLWTSPLFSLIFPHKKYVRDLELCHDI